MLKIFNLKELDKMEELAIPQLKKHAAKSRNGSWMVLQRYTTIILATVYCSVLTRNIRVFFTLDYVIQYKACDSIANISDSKKRMY